MPLIDDSVDAAVATMVLHHATDPAAMLREMARVVRPGGTVAICDEDSHPYEWMGEEHHDVWLGFSEEQVHESFTAAGLAAPRGARRQRNVRSTTSVEVATIDIFAAHARVADERLG